MESCRLIPVPGRRGDVCVLGETVKVSGVVQKKVCPLRPAAGSWGGQPFVFSGTKVLPVSNAGWMRRAVMLTSFAYATSHWGAVVGAWIEFRGAGRQYCGGTPARRANC